MTRLTILAAAMGLVAAATLLFGPDDPPRYSVAIPREVLPAQVAVAPGTTQPERPDTHSSGDAEAVATPARRNASCRVELRDYVAPDGQAFSAYRCVPLRPAPPHAYADYDNGSLEILAYADADAAALLGRRLLASNRAKARAMLVRATALDGDVTHLRWLADQAYPALRVNGELQVANVERRYELAALAARIGDNPALAHYLRDALVDAGVDERQLQALDARVDGLLRTMRDIQNRVYGEVRYGGQTDA